MLKIKVTEKSGASIEYTGSEELLSRLHAMGHGLPEREALHKDESGAETYDEADVLGEFVVEIIPAIPALIGQNGEELEPAKPAVTQKRVRLKSQYSVLIEDITAEFQAQQAIANRLKEYPSAEDFLNAFFDGGQPALDALQAKRLAIKAKYPKSGA